MASYVEPKIIVSLDDESKELIRQLVAAVDRIADVQAPEERSFADRVQRFVEAPVESIYTKQEVQEQGERFLRHIQELRGQFEGEGDWTLHDDNHEGEDTE